MTCPYDPTAGGAAAPFFGVNHVTVGFGDDEKKCDTEISFVLH